MDTAWQLLLTHFPAALAVCGGIAAVGVFVQNLYTIRKLRTDLAKSVPEIEKLTIDVEKAKLETQKLDFELEALRKKKEAEQARVTVATFAEIKEYAWRGKPGPVDQNEYRKPLPCPEMAMPYKKSAPAGLLWLGIVVVFLGILTALSAFVYYASWKIIIYTILTVMAIIGLWLLRNRKQELQKEVVENRNDITFRKDRLERAQAHLNESREKHGRAFPGV